MVKLPLPFGPKACLILMYLNNQAIRTKVPLTARGVPDRAAFSLARHQVDPQMKAAAETLNLSANFFACSFADIAASRENVGHPAAAAEYGLKLNRLEAVGLYQIPQRV
jgi:hypothetical protein